MNNYYPLIVQKLKEQGFSFQRTGRGSHEIWGKDASKPFTVAVTCKNRHTANAIMKAAGINHKF